MDGLNRSPLALFCAVGAVLLACNVKGDDSATTFLDPTNNPSTAVPDTSATATDTDTDSATGTPTSTTTPTTSASTDATTTDPTLTTTEPPTTTDPTTGDSDGQPMDGMYSHCLMATECVGQTLCVTILDAAMMPMDGFCTTPGCTDAATMCEPAPGGTAVPTCFPVMVNMVADMACALDCAGGAICPTGMQCFTLTDGSICA